jgi:hypothetical protein
MRPKLTLCQAIPGLPVRQHLWLSRLIDCRCMPWLYPVGRGVLIVDERRPLGRCATVNLYSSNWSGLYPQAASSPTTTTSSEGFFHGPLTRVAGREGDTVVPAGFCRHVVNKRFRSSPRRPACGKLSSLAKHPVPPPRCHLRHRAQQSITHRTSASPSNRRHKIRNSKAS